MNNDFRTKRVLINGTPIIRGGGLQAVCGFISTLVEMRDPELQWNYIVSPQVNNELKKLNCNCSEIKVLESPAKKRIIRKKIFDYCNCLKPDLVFTFMGPSYVRFDCQHLMGIADGWMTHSDLVAFSTLSGFPLNWLRVYGKILYKKYWTKFADGWVVEAKCARDGLAKFLNHGKNNINIVPNTAHKVYWGSNHDVSFPEKNNEIRILTFAGPYPHKNLDIIPDVARELINTYKINRIKFIVTLPENCSIWLSMQHFAKLKKVSDYIENRGVVPIVKGPELYNESHLQFMPTILETYSAVYPESLLMGIPIITTDMEFARDICGDAALYFKPKNYKDAALKIYQLISSKDTWDKIVSNGMQKKTSLITPDAKTAQYIDIIKKMVKQ